MICEVDHIFILTLRGAPAAEQLVKFGLTEGPPNVHPGQGTACRRFFFENAMLELLWIEDAQEAQSAQTRPTRLWDRWSQIEQAASPFGVILRPRGSGGKECPFEGWDYRPVTMPGLELRIAAATGLEEPMWCWLARAGAPRRVEHRAGLSRLTGIRIAGPRLPANSVAGLMSRLEVIGAGIAREHLLELEFDGAAHAKSRDFRPYLPLIFHW